MGRQSIALEVVQYVRAVASHRTRTLALDIMRSRNIRRIADRALPQHMARTSHPWNFEP
jgi:hypothetical protein